MVAKSKVIRTGCKDDSLVDSKRRDICKGAAKLFVKKGYHQTTVRQIAEACGLSIGTLYHYIGSKDDILFLLADYGVSSVSELTEEAKSCLETLTPSQALRVIIGDYIRMVDQGQDMIVFWYQQTANMRSDARKRVFDMDGYFRELFEELLALGSDAGEFEVEDITLAAHDICVLCDMWAFRRWALRGQVSLEEFIDRQVDFVLKAIARVPAQ